MHNRRRIFDRNTLAVPVSQRKRQLKSVPPAAGTERSREMRTKGRDEIPSWRRSEEIQFSRFDARQDTKKLRALLGSSKILGNWFGTGSGFWYKFSPIGVAKTIIANRPVASDAPQAPSQATLGFVPLPPPRQYRRNTPHSPILPSPGV